MAIRRPPTTFSDTISTADIADDAITGGKLANDIAISTTGNIATTGSGTLTVAGNTTLSGTNNLGSNPSITLGSNTTFPTNSILQLKHATRTTSYSDGSVDGNYTNVPSFEVSIYPSSASNKILVIANFRAANNNAGSHNGMVVRFRRSINDASYTLIGNELQTNTKDTYGYAITHVLTHIDTPNTTQKVEYSVGYADTISAHNSEFYFGRIFAEVTEPASEAVITAMELKT